MNKLLAKYSEYAIVLAIIFIVPLYFDLSVFGAFILPKKIIFDCLFFVLCLLWFGRVYFSEVIAWPKNNMLGLIIGALFMAEILSLIFSATPGQAWSGSALRQFGTGLHLQFLVFFLWVAVNFDVVKEKIHWLAASVAVSGAVVSLYGLAQVWGLDPWRWQVFGGELVRASSTLGQPNYLGSYLLGVLAVTALGFSLPSGRTYRILYFLALALEMLALAYSLSRGAWLGLIGTCLVILLAYLFDMRRKYFWAASSVLSVLLLAWLLIGISGAVSTSNFSNKSELTKRAVSILDFREGSIRGFYYGAALDLIKKRPLTGYGRDSLDYYFFRYYGPNWPIYETVNQATDRAHNFWLDLSLQVGLIGALAWLLLLFIILKMSFKALRSKPITMLSLLGLLAIIISWQVGFQTLEPALFFWLFAGLIIGEAIPDKIAIKAAPFWLAIAGSVIFFVSFLSLLNDYNRYQVGRLYQQVLTDVDVARNTERMQEILSLATISDLKSFYAAPLYSLIDDKLKIGRIDKKDLQEILASLEDLNVPPSKFEFSLNRLVFLTSMSKEIFWQGRGKEAARNLDRDFANLKATAPGYAVVELAWGNLFYNQRRCLDALAHYKLALALYPDLADARINEEHRSLIEGERNQVLVHIKYCEQALNNEIMKGVESRLPAGEAGKSKVESRKTE